MTEKLWLEFDVQKYTIFQVISLLLLVQKIYSKKLLGCFNSWWTTKNSFKGYLNLDLSTFEVKFYVIQKQNFLIRR